MASDRVIVTIQYRASSDSKQIESLKADVRLNVRFGDLLEAARRRLDIDSRYDCHLFLPEKQEKMDNDRTLREFGVMGDITLRLVKKRQSQPQTIFDKLDDFTQRRIRRPIPEGVQRLALQDERGDGMWQIEFTPAIIGRRNRAVPEQNFLLAVDLEELPNSREISRHHACLDLEDGVYYLYAVRPNNATYLEDEQIRYGQRDYVSEGDIIRFSVVSLKVIYL